VLIEEFNDENARYYVLTVLRGGYTTEIFRKIWFDRADLNVARLQSYGPKGALLSDVHVSDWQPLTAMPAGASAAANGSQSFPRAIRIDRPRDDYRLDLQVTKSISMLTWRLIAFSFCSRRIRNLYGSIRMAIQNNRPRIRIHDGRTDIP